MSHVQHAWQGKAYEICELEKAWWSLKIESWKCNILKIYIPQQFVHIQYIDYTWQQNNNGWGCTGVMYN